MWRWLGRSGKGKNEFYPGNLALSFLEVRVLRSAPEVRKQFETYGFGGLWGDQAVVVGTNEKVTSVFAQVPP